MHELSIAANIIEIAAEAAAQAGAERVENINVRIGPLSGVVKEALLFSFDVAAEGTICAGAKLTVEEVPVQVFCPRCQAIQTLPDVVPLACPVCHTPTADIRAGQELEIVSLELPEHVAAHR